MVSLKNMATIISIGESKYSGKLDLSNVEQFLDRWRRKWKAS